MLEPISLYMLNQPLDSIFGTQMQTKQSQYLPNQDQQILIHSVNYLAKAHLMSVRLISNFRTLFTFVLANQSTSSNQSGKVSQTLDDIQVDLGQLLSYLSKLVNNLIQNSQLQIIQLQLQALKQELNAIEQDAQHKYYIFSPLIYKFITNQSNVETIQENLKSTFINILIESEKSTYANDQILQLQQNIEILNDENNRLKNELLILKQFQQQQNYSQQAQQLNQQHPDVDILKQNIEDLRQQVKEQINIIDKQNNVIQILKDQLDVYRSQQPGVARLPQPELQQDNSLQQLIDTIYSKFEDNGIASLTPEQKLQRIDYELNNKSNLVQQLEGQNKKLQDQLSQLQQQNALSEANDLQNQQLKDEAIKLKQQLQQQKQINTQLKKQIDSSGIEQLLMYNSVNSIRDLQKYINELQQSSAEYDELKLKLPQVLNKQQKIEQSLVQMLQ